MVKNKNSKTKIERFKEKSSQLIRKINELDFVTAVENISSSNVHNVTYNHLLEFRNSSERFYFARVNLGRGRALCMDIKVKGNRPKPGYERRIRGTFP